MTKSELDRAVQIRLEEIHASLSIVDDESALNLLRLFPSWYPGEFYISGNRVRYKDKLYRVVQTHTSQECWEPPSVPALFTEIAKPGEVPVWKQPTGVQDAYNHDDLVYYPDENGSIWRSIVDANVWEPGVYGWELNEQREA